MARKRQAGIESAWGRLAQGTLPSANVPCFLPETSWTSILGPSMGEDETNGGSQDLTNTEQTSSPVS